MYVDYQTAKILHEARLKEAEERRRATASRQATLHRRRGRRGRSLSARGAARPAPGRDRRPARRRRLAAWLRPLLAR